MNDKIISVPTQEISEIVQKKLFNLGYSWLYYDKDLMNVQFNYGTDTYICITANGIIGYGRLTDYINSLDRKYDIIDLNDLWHMKPFKKNNLSIKINGKEITVPMSLETAKELGIII